MMIGRWGISAGLCRARCFQFVGMQWSRSYDGIICWFGVGRVAVFFVRVWKEEP